MENSNNKDRIRCFVAIKFDLVAALAPLLKELARIANDPDTKLRIAPPENLHITLKFLGAIEIDQLGMLESLLLNISSKVEPLDLQCSGIGFFKNSIWVGIENNLKLAELATSIDEACSILGYQSETRSYVPHLTVARFGKDARIKLSELQQKFGQTSWGMIHADAIHLYQSVTQPAGAKYSILKTFELATEN